MLSEKEVIAGLSAKLEKLEQGQKQILERLIQLETRNEVEHKVMADRFTALDEELRGIQHKSDTHTNILSRQRGGWAVANWVSNVIWAALSGVGVYLMMHYFGKG